jgi:hypothetical protein
MSATSGATAAAPPNLLMLKTCVYPRSKRARETIIRQQKHFIVIINEFNDHKKVDNE